MYHHPSIFTEIFFSCVYFLFAFSKIALCRIETKQEGRRFNRR